MHRTSSTASRGRGPAASRWALFPAALLAALTWLAVLPGLSRAPSGVGPGLDLGVFVLPRLAGDLFLVAALAAAAALPLLARGAPARRVLADAHFTLLGAAGLVLLLAAFVDAMVYRYLSERLDVLMLFEYRIARDPRFVARLVGADLAFVSSALAGIAAFLLAGLALRRRSAVKEADAGPRQGTALALLVLACGSFAVTRSGLIPAEAWRNARPPAWALADEALRPPYRGGLPEQYLASASGLRRLLGHAEAWYPNRLAPLWHEAPDEKGSVDRFRARPLAERPDILLVVFESLRGWEFDFREEGAKESFPRLHDLFLERGTQLTSFQSNGFPSVEGWASIHLGLWPHPRFLLLERGYRPLFSLPEVLGRAGYWRTIVSPQPWGDVAPWYEAWYDERVLGARMSDEEMVQRFTRLYDAAPPGRPRFMTWVTVSTHPPLLDAPGRAAAADRGSRERYLFAARETDREIGAILDHVRAAGNWDRTLVVVVGDHSTSNGWIALRTPRLGTPNAGETWSGLLWAAPRGPGGKIDTRIASQVDVAPTVLGALGLEVSNAFVGRDLFAPVAPGSREPPALSLHIGGIAVTDGEFRLHFRLDDPAFLRKFRWKVRASSALEDGGYRHGEELAVHDRDREEAAGYRALVETYGYILAGSHIFPPRGGRIAQAPSY